MKFIHTSDWHLGKCLEGFSRFEEQESFINDFIKLTNEKNPDMVIIAGDIFDSSNPSAKAEGLFYTALKQISNNGARLVLIIAGNHDSPERLTAANPIVREQGIIMLGTPKEYPEIGEYGGFKVIQSSEGFLKVIVHGEKAAIITMPYPSEKRLNEMLDIEDEAAYDIDTEYEEMKRKSYSARIGEIFTELSHKFSDDSVNIVVSHLYIAGGEASDSERPVQIGGGFAVEAGRLPKNAHYIALGHLHRPQKVNGILNTYYAGSPLQYSKSEINYAKGCKLIIVNACDKPDNIKIEDIYFNNYRPIEIWKCNSIDDAIEKCRVNSDKKSWVYLEIKTDTYISNESIKMMKDYKEGIVEIKPIIEDKASDESYEDIKEKNIEELFKSFYLSQRNVEPSPEVMDMFFEIIGDEDTDNNEEKISVGADKGRDDNEA